MMTAMVLTMHMEGHVMTGYTPSSAVWQNTTMIYYGIGFPSMFPLAKLPQITDQPCH